MQKPFSAPVRAEKGLQKQLSHSVKVVPGQPEIPPGFSVLPARVPGGLQARGAAGISARPLRSERSPIAAVENIRGNRPGALAWA